MRVAILGCSGGIGDGLHTTSFLIDDDILIDAGSGVSRLSRAALARIDHVFITHSHLDHILTLPLLLDSVANERDCPVVLHAIPEVLEILKDHVFNWRIWPDFSRIPSLENPFMRYHPIALGHPVSLTDAQLGLREITSIPAHHVVPTTGFHLRGQRGSLLFSGDTNSHPALWALAELNPDLLHLVVECSFTSDQREVAEASCHYHAAELAADLERLRVGPEVWITHLKPGGEVSIMAELRAKTSHAVKPLMEGQVLTI
jgi:ribonuclease BN (tRNA processing enzyme)